MKTVIFIISSIALANCIVKLLLRRLFGKEGGTPPPLFKLPPIEKQRASAGGGAFADELARRSDNRVIAMAAPAGGLPGAGHHDCGWKNRIDHGIVADKTYTCNDGVFRIRGPRWAVNFEDQEGCLVMNDMIGGFLLVRHFQIPAAEIELIAREGALKSLGNFLRGAFIPSIGGMVVKEARAIDSIAGGGAFVIGGIPGGSDFARYTPDGKQEKMDEILAILAIKRQRYAFVYMRGYAADMTAIKEELVAEAIGELVEAVKDTEFFVKG